MSGRTAATCLVAGALLLQFLAGFKLLAPPKRFESLQPLRVAPSPALWPFLDYDMYTRAWGEGTVGHRYLLVALFADGSERPLREADFGCTWRGFRDEILYPLRDDQPGALDRAVAGFALRGAARPAAFRVDCERLVIVRDGLQPRPRQVLRALSLDGGAP